MRSYAYYADIGPRTKVLNGFRSIFRTKALEQWLRNRTEGQRPTNFWVRLIPPEYTYPKGSIRTCRRNGLDHVLDISNTTDHAAYFGYTDEAFDHLYDLIKPDQTIVDIGGNIGIRAMAFARSVPDGRVYTFEPDPDNYGRLQRHLTINGLTNIEAIRCGIGNEVATHRLYRVVASNSGMNRIITTATGHEHLPYHEIQVMPLSQALAGRNVPCIDVIKVDVEGFEAAVLSGCADIIARDHPLLFVELDDDNLNENGGSARSLVTQIEHMGYTVIDALTMAPIHPKDDLAHCHIDILCSPRSTP